jgi:hypothetical protein
MPFFIRRSYSRYSQYLSAGIGIPPAGIYSSMRAAFLMFVALALGRTASAGALLSVGAAAGTETCRQAAASLA